MIYLYQVRIDNKMEEKQLREYKIMYIISAIHAILHLIGSPPFMQLASFGKTSIYLQEQVHFYHFHISVEMSPW